MNVFLLWDEDRSPELNGIINWKIKWEHLPVLYTICVDGLECGCSREWHCFNGYRSMYSRPVAWILIRAILLCFLSWINYSQKYLSPVFSVSLAQSYAKLHSLQLASSPTCTVYFPWRKIGAHSHCGHNQFPNHHFGRSVNAKSACCFIF